MPKLSVIIPVFNVASYLDGCLASVCDQTFRDMEIICIDDGSSDSSGEILSRWADSDPRIRVFRQPNSGPSRTRNAGLDQATGDYVVWLLPMRTTGLRRRCTHAFWKRR